MKRIVVSALFALLALVTVQAGSVRQMHEEMLYTVVRVRSGNALGSGTVLFSGKDATGEYHTYVLTNHHVVADLIKVSKRWNPVLKRKIDQEILGKPFVEFFQYNNLSEHIGSFSVEAEIVAYDGAEDLALLRLRDREKGAKHVALIFPRGKTSGIYLYNEVWAAGAALGQAPIITHGHLVYQNMIIENFEYWMSTALTIFGNSGGAVFRPANRGYEFIGVPSRISVMQGGQAITHMGYFIPIHRIYNFLERNFYMFIWDSTYTIEKAQKLRDEQVSRSLGKVRIGE